MEKPTEAQQKELNKLAWPFLFKTFFNSANHIGLLLAINYIIVLAHGIWFSRSPIWTTFIFSGIAAIFMMRRMNAIRKEINTKLVADCKAILEK